MTHVQLHYCSNDAMAVMNHSCSYFISNVDTCPLKMGSSVIIPTFDKIYKDETLVVFTV